MFASINAEIDLNVAKKIGEKYGFTVRKEEKKRSVIQPVASARKAAKSALEERWKLRRNRCCQNVRRW